MNQQYQHKATKSIIVQTPTSVAVEPFNNLTNYGFRRFNDKDLFQCHGHSYPDTLASSDRFRSCYNKRIFWKKIATIV